MKVSKQENAMIEAVGTKMDRRKRANRNSERAIVKVVARPEDTQ